MNWIKRNWEYWLLAAFFLSGCVTIWTTRNQPPSTLRLELTAHAQKPEPRQIEDNEVLGVKVDRQRTVLFVVPPDFWAQVEQHCVAVLTEKLNENPPTISFSHPLLEMDEKGNAVAHIPEQTLKLRCQSEEKSGSLPK